ncbi:MAG: hypothetical protein ACUVQ0_03680 [Thermoproteota archaeon]
MKTFQAIRSIGVYRRIGIVGQNFSRTLVYILSKMQDSRIILFDLNDEFSCIARIGLTRYCNLAEHTLNPVKPPKWENVEKYVESLVEVMDYCFGVLNVKSILAKALLDSISTPPERTIPEIASKLDFETPEGGLSIYTPLEPFTFGTMRRTFGRREDINLNRILETGVVLDLSSLPTAYSKAFVTLMVMSKLALLEPSQHTVIAVTYPSVVWSRVRRRDNSQVFTEEVLIGDLERKGYSIILAEKNFLGVSERVLDSLDSIIFSPPREALNPSNPWRTMLYSEYRFPNSPALILSRSGETIPLEININTVMKPLSVEERGEHKPDLNNIDPDEELRESLGEDYEAGMRIINMIKETGGRISLNNAVERVRFEIGSGGLRALATLLRQGYLKQVEENGEQLLIVSER